MLSLRNSLAIDHHHPLRPLALLGFSDSDAFLFFAEAKLPSRNILRGPDAPARSTRGGTRARYSVLTALGGLGSKGAILSQSAGDPVGNTVRNQQINKFSSKCRQQFEVTNANLQVTLRPVIA